MDQQAARRFERIRAVQSQLSFRVARQVQTTRLAQRPTGNERSIDPRTFQGPTTTTSSLLHPQSRAAH